VDASRSAHISCNDFGSANARTGTARMSRAEPCKQRRSARPSEGEAYATQVKGQRWLAGPRRRADEWRWRARLCEGHGSSRALHEAASAEEPNWSSSHRKPPAQRWRSAAARREPRCGANSQSAQDSVKNRSDRAVGCMDCWAGRRVGIPSFGTHQSQRLLQGPCHGRARQE
jgi:hypothetical protein